MTRPNDEVIALCDVAITARLFDPLAEFETVQTYRNDEPGKVKALHGRSGCDRRYRVRRTEPAGVETAMKRPLAESP